jgi:hypothetical protein
MIVTGNNNHQQTFDRMEQLFQAFLNVADTSIVNPFQAETFILPKTKFSLQGNNNNNNNTSFRSNSMNHMTSMSSALPDDTS